MRGSPGYTLSLFFSLRKVIPDASEGTNFNVRRRVRTVEKQIRDGVVLRMVEEMRYKMNYVQQMTEIEDHLTLMAFKSLN